MANGHSTINYEIWCMDSGNCIYYTENFNEIAELMRDNPEYAKVWVVAVQFPDHENEIGLHIFNNDICMKPAS